MADVTLAVGLRLGGVVTDRSEDSLREPWTGDLHDLHE